MVDVLILGGAPNDGALQASSSEPHEALIPICSRPMVEYVIQAVREAARTDKIALVGPVEICKHELAVQPDVYIEMGDSIIDNLQKGLKALDVDDLVLLMSGDIPLISSAAIDDFIDKACNNEGDIFYPLVAQTVCEQHFPGMERTYVRMKEGVFTGGNLGLIKPQVILEGGGRLRRIFEYRKKTWKLSRLLGPTFLLRYALGRLSIKQVEKKILKTIGYKGVCILTDFAEIAFDVDKPSDLELITGYIKKATGGDCCEKG